MNVVETFFLMCCDDFKQGSRFLGPRGCHNEVKKTLFRADDSVSWLSSCLSNVQGSPCMVTSKTPISRSPASLSALSTDNIVLKKFQQRDIT